MSKAKRAKFCLTFLSEEEGQRRPRDGVASVFDTLAGAQPERVGLIRRGQVQLLQW